MRTLALVTIALSPGVDAQQVAPGDGPRFVRPAEPRIRPVEPAAWTAEDREVLGPHARGEHTEASAMTCLRHLELCRQWRRAFVVYVNGPTSTLRPRERELLRLRSFFLHHDDFAWNAHWPRAGSSPRVRREEVVRITKGPRAEGWTDAEATLLHAVDELQRDRFIHADTWMRLAERYSDPQLLDVIFVAGHDAMNGMFLNSVAVPLQPGATAYTLLGEKHLLPPNANAKRVGSFERPKTPRIEPLDSLQWTDAHHTLLGSSGQGTQTAEWLTTCLRNLSLCWNWLPLARYTTSDRSTLPARDRELLHLRTFYLGRSDYGWSERVQEGHAKRAGVSDEDVQRITRGAVGAGWAPFDAALVRAADELHSDRFIQDATWKLLAERYDEKQLLDLIFTVAEDTIFSMFVNTVGVRLKEHWTGVPRL